MRGKLKDWGGIWRRDKERYSILSLCWKKTLHYLNLNNPLHGVYAYAQNKLSVFVGQLADLPALSKLINAYEVAEDEYMPSGPPTSPLTKSYFSCWGLFDLCIGLKKETFCTIAVDVCRFLGVDSGLVRIFELMQKTRMGIYVNEGEAGKFVNFREIITQEKIRAIVPSGYVGKVAPIHGHITFLRISLFWGFRFFPAASTCE